MHPSLPFPVGAAALVASLLLPASPVGAASAPPTPSVSHTVTQTAPAAPAYRATFVPKRLVHLTNRICAPRSYSHEPAVIALSSTSYTLPGAWDVEYSVKAPRKAWTAPKRIVNGVLYVPKGESRSTFFDGIVVRRAGAWKVRIRLRSPQYPDIGGLPAPQDLVGAWSRERTVKVAHRALTHTTRLTDRRALFCQP